MLHPKANVSSIWRRHEGSIFATLISTLPCWTDIIAKLTEGCSSWHATPLTFCKSTREWVLEEIFFGGIIMLVRGSVRQASFRGQLKSYIWAWCGVHISSLKSLSRWELGRFCRPSQGLPLCWAGATKPRLLGSSHLALQQHCSLHRLLVKA